MKLWIYLAASAAILASGFGAGYFVRDYQGMQRGEACARGITDGTLVGCRPVITRAFAARAAELAAQDTAVRDDAIASVTQGAQEQVIIYRERAADTAALNNVERTDQCATSPAFQLRREQLQRYAEGSSSDEPDPAQPPG